MFLGAIFGFLICLVLVTLFPKLGLMGNEWVRFAWAWFMGLITGHFGGPLTATADGNVSVAAYKLHLGLTSVAYAAVPNAVRGLQPGERYYIWCIDEHFAGGMRTWRASKDLDAIAREPGAVVAGAITIPLADTAP